MIAFLTIIYVGLAWLVFFKFRLLTFDLKNKIATVVLGLLLVCGILIAVNFLHPMTLDARVYQHVIAIAPRTSAAARVTEVVAAPNTPLKKGDVLFRLDARPFQYVVDRLTAQAASAEQSVPQLASALTAADAAVQRIDAERELAQITLDRDLEVQKTTPGAVTQQKLDQDHAQLAATTAELAEAKAQVDSARVAIDLSDETIAEAKAQLATAKLNLEEATVTAPADGYVTIVELRPGFIVAPGQQVMSFVCEPEGVVGATLAQEYAAGVKPGDEVELCLDVYPGKTLHGKVDAVIWATGEGELTVSGTLPTTAGKSPAARIPIKIIVSDEDRKRYPLPAGASGAAAFYTEHGRSFCIVRRVMIRWYTWLNYVKLSM